MSNYTTTIQKTIVDDNGIEIIIEVSQDAEGFNLEMAELIIAGVGLVITPSLTPRQVKALLGFVDREDFIKE